MKIAMFTDSYYPTIDGAVISLTTTSRELRRRGHDVVVVAPEPTRELPSDIPDRVVWLPAREFGGYPGYRNAIYPSSIVSMIRQEAPDILHSHGISFVGIQALIASRNTKIRNALTYHTMLTEAASFYSPPIMPLDILLKLAWIYQRNFLKRPHLVITPTDAIRRELEAMRIRAKRWEVIPTGVDCNRFHPDIDGRQFRESLGIDGEKTILTVGRVAKEKNLKVMFGGLRSLLTQSNDVKLVVAGTGPAMHEYKNLAKSMGLDDRVIFTGFIPDELLPACYASCDVFAIASPFETQGLVVLEAMACGKPVVGLNHRALPELIQDGENGYLFDDNPDSFSIAINRALGANSSKVPSAARRTAENLSVEKSTDRLIHAYEQLMGN